MRALVKSKAEPGLWMEDVEIPRPSDRDVLIRVRKTSVCGTDLHILKVESMGRGDDQGANGHRSRVHG